MKNLLLLFALVSFVAFNDAAAQKKCNHSEKAAATTAVDNSESDEVAAQAASLDENIERRVCSKSGKVSYWKKDVNEKSGEVSTSEVTYDAAEAKFVNVSPSKKAACAKKKAACAKKTATAKKASMKKKGCCSKGSKKSCSSKKSSADAKSSTDATSSEKTVKTVNLKSISEEGTNK